ncbi:Adenylate kinase [Methanolacinia petrolearia DSM 11571]|uniref:Putative adenylate kinase n=1 Tax=Methanolacinia petrolearia (strain DSM 11571 / OCM 486 / SEBR 4847) TaxID=679926 RepID=E1RDU4_METP4|nr:adenylate kinase family protein [Methanolacinia petrolearia]ADN37131.1 Adenylate kinase [Methanolacinia petrolearia DSM 11571]
MMTCISGIPGTGKSSVSAVLKRMGHDVVLQNDTTGNYFICDDPDRDAAVIDEDLWASEFRPVNGIVEGHLTHLLECDRLVILRCRPDVLKERLVLRGYSPEKVHENVEAEALDTILIEALENHKEDIILELDTTERTPEEIATEIDDFIHGRRGANFGNTDWSEYLGTMI